MDQIATQHQFPLDYLFSTLDPDEVPRAEQKNQPTIKEPILISLLYPYKSNHNVNDGSYQKAAF